VRFGITISTKSCADECERHARFQQFLATLPQDRDSAGPVVLPLAISAGAGARPWRPEPSIASIQLALQEVIASFASFLELRPRL
jgi:hypothetical protein